MNEYGIWNIMAVLIAAAAFFATQLTSRRNERASFLLDRVTVLTKELEAKTEELKDKVKEVTRLTEENLLLMRRLAGMQEEAK